MNMRNASNKAPQPRDREMRANAPPPWHNTAAGAITVLVLAAVLSHWVAMIAWFIESLGGPNTAAAMTTFAGIIASTVQAGAGIGLVVLIGYSLRKRTWNRRWIASLAGALTAAHAWDWLWSSNTVPGPTI